MIKPNEYASRFMLHDLRFTICFTICLFISPDLDGMFTNKQNASSHDMLADSKPSAAPKILELFVGLAQLPKRSQFGLCFSGVREPAEEKPRQISPYTQ